jgi:hypothetical protein
MILVQAGNGRLPLVHMRACRLQVRRRCCLKPGLLTVSTTKDLFVSSGKTVQEGDLLHSILLLTLQQEVNHV